MLTVEIDKDAGFCFGVVTAIQSAERELRQAGTLYCLGDIVHNSLEVERLRRMGLQTVNHEGFRQLQGTKVLLRAHGEPPATYDLARRNNITVIDATCPVVLRLQRKIHNCYTKALHTHTQLVIYGKKGHAEVNGLVGQTGGTALVVERPEDLDLLDYTRPIALFSQTTMSPAGFQRMVKEISRRMTASGTSARFDSYDTICRQVSNRLTKIQAFAARHDRIYFVAGDKSSNGQMLFDECSKANPDTILISGAEEAGGALPDSIRSVGVCGATSTPKWLMEEVAAKLLSK